MKPRYSLQQYLYDAYRLGLIELEVAYLNDVPVSGAWLRERIALLTKEAMLIQQRMEAYEKQPRNQPRTTYHNGDHRSSSSVEGE